METMTLPIISYSSAQLAYPEGLITIVDSTSGLPLTLFRDHVLHQNAARGAGNWVATQHGSQILRRKLVLQTCLPDFSSVSVEQSPGYAFLFLPPCTCCSRHLSHLISQKDKTYMCASLCHEDQTPLIKTTMKITTSCTLSSTSGELEVKMCVLDSQN